MTIYGKMTEGNLLIPVTVKRKIIEESNIDLKQQYDDAKSSLDFMSRRNNELTKTLEQYKKELAYYRPSGRYWITLEKIIREDEMLQSAWMDFISILRLRHEKIIPGITGPASDTKDNGTIEQLT